MKGSYDDILFLPHPSLEGHPRMEIQDRAVQFSSFDALTGQDDVLEEAEQKMRVLLEKDGREVIGGCVG